MVYPAVKSAASRLLPSRESQKPFQKRSMDMYARAALCAATFCTALALPVSAQPGRCTREVLHVQGTPATVTLCVVSSGPAAGHDMPVTVGVTLTAPRGSFSRTDTLHFLAYQPDPRVNDDVPLASLGIPGTLHMTLMLHGGLVHIDAAMKMPGAVWLK